MARTNPCSERMAATCNERPPAAEATLSGALLYWPWVPSVKMGCVWVCPGQVGLTPPAVQRGGVTGVRAWPLNAVKPAGQLSSAARYAIAASSSASSWPATSAGRQLSGAPGALACYLDGSFTIVCEPVSLGVAAPSQAARIARCRHRELSGGDLGWSGWGQRSG